MVPLNSIQWFYYIFLKSYLLATFSLYEKWIAFRASFGTLRVFSVSSIISTVISWDFSMPFAMRVTRLANIPVCVPCQIKKISNPKIISTGGIRTHHPQIANLTPLCIRLTALTYIKTMVLCSMPVCRLFLSFIANNLCFPWQRFLKP